MNGPIIATIEIRRVPFDGGYSFNVERAGVPLEDHPFVTPFDPPMPPYGTETIADGLQKIAAVLDEIEQAGP